VHYWLAFWKHFNGFCTEGPDPCITFLFVSIQNIQSSGIHASVVDLDSYFYTDRPSFLYLPPNFP
tara:strand:+ start:622 stop:816 length:195 start_codon:yes stop_codon:yes gene_type:complete